MEVPEVPHTGTGWQVLGGGGWPTSCQTARKYQNPEPYSQSWAVPCSGVAMLTPSLTCPSVDF